MTGESSSEGSNPSLSASTLDSDDPRADGPGLGLGMPIIGALAQSVELREADSGGTELVMRFSLA